MFPFLNGAVAGCSPSGYTYEMYIRMINLYKGATYIIPIILVTGLAHFPLVTPLSVMAATS